MQSRNIQPLLVHVTTIPGSFGLLKGQIGFMKERGFNVHGLTSPGPGYSIEEIETREKIKIDTITMTRSITPLRDAIAIVKCISLFIKLRPFIIHASTPKASLISIIAGRLTRVPVVIYTIRGFPFVTKTGWQRSLLIKIETLLCRLSHRVFAVSSSTLRIATEEKICKQSKIRILGNGSGNGIDAENIFNPRKVGRERRLEVRKKYNIPKNAVVIGYVGRIVKEKGIVELAEAWDSIRKKSNDIFLMIVGNEEKHDPVPEVIMQRLRQDERVIFTGSQKAVADYYAAIDILTLPSHREGMGSTPLEAAAMKRPAVITDIDGLRETVIHNETGIIVPFKNKEALITAFESLVENASKRKIFGEAGRTRVIREFSPMIIWKALYYNYLELLSIKLDSKVMLNILKKIEL